MHSTRSSGALAARRYPRALLCLLALLLPAQAVADAAPPGPAPSAMQIVPLAQPGSRAAASLSQRGGLQGPDGRAFIGSPSGLLVPDNRIFVAKPEDLRDRGRWAGIRRGVFRYLKANDVRPAPARYQQVVAQIRQRAGRALQRQGLSLDGWKMIAVQGGMADVANAAAWSGGVITINRPMVDLCFQIASVLVSASTPEQRDRELWRLSRWREKGALDTPPEALRVNPAAQPRRDAIAESILARVVLHEMGHAASGHVALEREIIVPSPNRRDDLTKSLAQENEADRFAVRLGLVGGTRIPGVMPFLDYYRFIDNPTFSARGRYALADWRTHPISADRYNNQRRELAPKVRGLPEPLEPRLIAADRPYRVRGAATPAVAAPAAPR